MVVAQKGLLVMMTKLPFVGEVKTRLAEGMGDVLAADLSWAMVIDSIEVLKPFDSQLDLQMAVNDPPAWLRKFRGVEVIAQGQGDLGQRLTHVTKQALQDYPWVLLIGSDSPHISSSLLQEAIQVMQAGNNLLGATEDGGYYIQGLQTCPADLFAGIAWSDPQTFAMMLRAHEEKLAAPTTTMPRSFDIDRAEDLKRLRDMQGADATRKLALRTFDEY